MSQSPEQTMREKVADAFQELADKDTDFRFDNAHQVGALIAATEPGWEIARATAALVMTDMTDGFWARTAKKIRGYDVVTEGGAKDPAADHLTVQSILGGLEQRARVHDDGHTSLWLAQLKHRSDMRNQRMDENRAIIAAHPDIDQREVRASRLNKAKMVFQVLGGVALVSPLSEKKPGRVAGIAVVQFGTWLGELGERKFRTKVDNLVIAADNRTKQMVSGPRPMHLRER